MENKFVTLLNEYRSIWNNRLLENNEESSQSVLMEAIRREISDENSHPRIRKNKYEKFYFATKRIVEANISNEAKLELITLHKKVVEQN